MKTAHEKIHSNALCAKTNALVGVHDEDLLLDERGGLDSGVKR